MNSTLRWLVALSLLIGPAAPSMAYHSANDATEKDAVQIAKLPFFGGDQGDANAKKESTAKTDSKPAADKKTNKSRASDAEKKSDVKDKSDKTAQKEEGTTEKKGGFFKSKKKDKDEPATASEKTPAKDGADKTEARPQAKEAAGTKDDAQKSGDTAERPAFTPDASLISVLKDLSKALKDEEQLTKLVEDPNQRSVVEAAQVLLGKSLEAPDLTFNRIISKEEERSVASALTPEAWASGDLKISEDHRGSLSAVWAKRVNGLLNVTIAGRTNKAAPNGRKIGNFVVVLVGRSPIEAGFDIQTQANVNFWLGQLSGITVDSDCLSQTADDSNKANLPDSDESLVKKNSIAVLPILLTDRVRVYQEKVKAFEEQQRLIAQKLEDERKAKEESEAANTRVIAEAAARALVEAASKSKTEPAPLAGDESRTIVSAPRVEGPAMKPATAYPSKSSTPIVAAKTESEPPFPVASTTPKTNTTTSGNVTLATARVSPAGQYGWESPALATQSKQPSLNAIVVLPERAVAGQFLTASVIDGNKQAEGSVELSFNGATLATDSSGHALYMVPEDATPGRSLNVSLSSRPELSPGVVEVLQPLTSPSDRDMPKIDKITPVVAAKGTLVIDGHSFDGNAGHNRILIDAFHEARIIAASPVQIKAILPSGLSPGQHSICVGNAGLRSNSATTEVITAEVQQDPREANKDSLSKFIVKVLGTTSRVQVRLTNNSPEVIKFSKGNELRFTTPGGANNTVIVGAQRLKKGSFNVEAIIEQ